MGGGKGEEREEVKRMVKSKIKEEALKGSS